MLKLAIILLFLMLLIGGDRGGKSLVVLFGNIIIAFVCIELLGHGINAFLVLVISTFLFCSTTIFSQNGTNIKTIASCIAVAVLMIFVCIAVYFICYKAHITGLNEIDKFEEETQYITSAVSINMLNILIVGLVWGQLGAIIDTSISISTAMNEIKENNILISEKELYKSGMNIGKDILGTTVNTLIFVAMGESIMLSLLYISSHYSLEQLINSKSFFQEVAAIVISCAGCVLIIPLTAFVYILIIRRKNKRS